MQLLKTSLLFGWAVSVTAVPAKGIPACRFASQYSQQDVLKDPGRFIQDLLYWEGQFHRNNVSYDTGNGMSYDGTQIDWTTGAATQKHPFSAASKEVRTV
jgi:hypothetical protein